MTEGNTAGHRLLVLESDPEHGEEMARALADLGFDVVGRSPPGLPGVEAAGRYRPDLVIVNVRAAAGMDDAEIARAIDEVYDIPTIYVCPEDGGEDLGRRLRAAPYGVLRMPFGLDRLRTAVDLALRRSRPGRAPDEEPAPSSSDREIFAVLDASGEVEYVSPSIEAVLGVAPERQVGREFFATAHPDDRPRAREAVRAAFADPDRPLDVRTRFRTKSGDWRPLRVEGRVYGTLSGRRTAGDGREPLWMVTSAREVDAADPRPAPRRRARVDRGESRYRRLFHRSGAGLFEATPEGRIKRANDALARMLGYASRHELAGCSLDELVPDAAADARLPGAIRRGRTLVGEEVRLRTSGNTEVVALVCTNVVRSDGEGGRSVVGTVMDITERKRQEADLQRMAFEDPLTGLANRRALGEHAARYLALAERRDAPLGVVYLDLARFKDVNDRFGHSAGDAVLVEVARRLEAGARESDILARLGGDEFAALLPEVSGLDAAVNVARRMARELRSPIAVGSSETTVMAEIGVSVHPDHGTCLDDLLRAADRAMYRAKANRDADGEGPTVVAATETGSVGA